MGIYNSSKHCHIAAILLTFNETAGDYYFAARAARNVENWRALRRKQICTNHLHHKLNNVRCHTSTNMSQLLCKLDYN